jgi:hypothetical protein
VFSILEVWPLHEISVVILSEIVLNEPKIKSMINTIIKLSTHITISFVLAKLEYFANYAGGLAIPFGR